jgi:hypothetical protein
MYQIDLGHRFLVFVVWGEKCLVEDVSVSEFSEDESEAK